MKFLFLFITAILTIFVFNCAIGQNRLILIETIEEIKKIIVLWSVGLQRRMGHSR